MTRIPSYPLPFLPSAPRLLLSPPPPQNFFVVVRQQGRSFCDEATCSLCAYVPFLSRLSLYEQCHDAVSPLFYRGAQTLPSTTEPTHNLCQLLGFCRMIHNKKRGTALILQNPQSAWKGGGWRASHFSSHRQRTSPDFPRCLGQIPSPASTSRATSSAGLFQPLALPENLLRDADSASASTR